MTSLRLKPGTLVLAAAALALAACSGSDGADGANGADGVDGAVTINASQVSGDFLGELDVKSEITEVKIGDTTSVTFTLASGSGVPITGIVPFWEADHRYVRFTLTKLALGQQGNPDSWVSYIRDETSGEPDYDSGAELVDHGDGSYTFTFNTDVTSVAGVPFESDLTHRLAGQLGSSSVRLEPQNFVHDFVPDGGVVLFTRDIVVMESCNECHDDLVFHGRRFRTEYCVNCHNPDLAQGEGDFSYMVHRIHAAGDFAVLDDAISYAEVTYPQDLANCSKCHDGDDPATPDGDNWRGLPSLAACFGCHDPANHDGGQPPATNADCTECHSATDITAYHTTPNSTPNNPWLLDGQVEIAYELVDANVDPGNNELTVRLRILSDGVPLDVANLPADLEGPGRYPALLLAWALPQEGYAKPLDFNNIGQRAAQALSLGLEDFFNGEGGNGPLGSHSFDIGSGVNTFVSTHADGQFPLGATLRTVGLQGYFQQDLGTSTVSLHAPSAMLGVSGDTPRRRVVDEAKCASCHEWFEGHGGNRTYNVQICTMCHVPNLSSTGRTVTDPTLRSLDENIAQAIIDGLCDPSVAPNDPLTYPEDAQSFKDLVHGIHSSDYRERDFVHVRGPSRQSYYNWSEVTFPRGASTSSCDLCHEDGSYELPLASGLLSSTIRQTSVADGQDPDVSAVEKAVSTVPGDNDWVSTPTASSCFGCHTSVLSMSHMEQNGAKLSMASGLYWTNRVDLGENFEACAVCHGPGKTADIDLVHNK
jgi:OmcA/MtrC family decaheme c-type cytochrome